MKQVMQWIVYDQVKNAVRSKFSCVRSSHDQCVHSLEGTLLKTKILSSGIKTQSAIKYQG